MEELHTPTFIQWIKAYDGVHTYCNDIKIWINGERKFKKVTDRETLTAIMHQDKYFEERHFRKVDIAFETYTEEMRKLKK